MTEEMNEADKLVAAKAAETAKTAEASTDETHIGEQEFEEALTEPNKSTLTEAELDGIDAMEDASGLNQRVDSETPAPAGIDTSVTTLTRLLELLETSPDNMVIYGYGGMTISLLDLRNIKSAL